MTQVIIAWAAVGNIGRYPKSIYFTISICNIIQFTEIKILFHLFQKGIC